MSAQSRPVGRLHVIISDSLGDATWGRPRFERLDLARRVLQGGADTIQYRRKVGVLREWVEEGRKIRDLCAATGATFIVNDHFELLEQLDADGLHLGLDDRPLSDARKLFPEKIIGGTARGLSDLHHVAAAGADYAGFGPIWESGSKSIAVEARGVERLRQVASEVELPIVAIGGIDRERALICRAAGAHGVAVIGAVAGADDPESVVRDMMVALAPDQ